MARGTCGETHFWPFFDPLYNPEWGISRGFKDGASTWPQTASKRAQNAFLSTPHGRGLSLKKHVLGHFSTPFRSQNGPLEGLLGPNIASKRSMTGSKQPENVSSTTPNSLGSFWAKTQFWPFSDPFWNHFGVILHLQGRLLTVLGPNHTIYGRKTGKP